MSGERYSMSGAKDAESRIAVALMKSPELTARPVDLMKSTRLSKKGLNDALRRMEGRDEVVKNELPGRKAVMWTYTGRPGEKELNLSKLTNLINDAAAEARGFLLKLDEKKPAALRELQNYIFAEWLLPHDLYTMKCIRGLLADSELRRKVQPDACNVMAHDYQVHTKHMVEALSKTPGSVAALDELIADLSKSYLED